MPNGWAAAGRLRVACFLAGFFETMVEYMDDASKCNNIKKWREHLVYKEASENRDAFWYTVTKAALSKLRKDNGRLQREWMDNSGTRTNGKIEKERTKLLKPSIIAFFKH